MAQETSTSKTSDQMIRLNVFPLFRTFLPPPLPPLFAPATQAIFLHVSDRFPFQESRISAIVNVCLCSGHAKFRTGNLLFCSSSGGNVKILSGNLTGFSAFPLP